MGEVSREDDDYFGDPVVEAARLCAQCDSGQILATEGVSTGDRRPPEPPRVPAPRGELALKGLAQPIEDSGGAVGAGGGCGRFGPRCRAGWRVRRAMCNRGHRPRAAGSRCYTKRGKRAHSTKRCQVVSVAGEAGLGQDRLGGAGCSNSTHVDGSIVLFGHADEDLQDRLISHGSRRSRYNLLRDGDPELVGGLAICAALRRLARLVPEGRAPMPTGWPIPETERLLLLEGATELLVAAITEHCPLPRGVG